MAANNPALTIKVNVDASGAVTGFDTVTRKSRDLGKAAKDAAAGVDVGDAANKKLGESSGRLAGIMEKASAGFGKFKAGIAALAVPATIAVGAISGVAVAAGKLAADAEQNVGAVGTVFGQASNKVLDFSKNASNSVGMSASSYNKLAASIGGSLKQAGYDQDTLAKKTHELMLASADLSSVFGGDAVEAAGAMGAAFRGEFDPLERFGIFLNQNAVNMELARTGQDKLTGAALEAAKKQATQNLIMKQAADYQGNFAREADTAAGAQQRMRAALQDAGAELGTMLLPLMVKGAQMLKEFIGVAQRNPAAVKAVAVGVSVLAVAILALNAAMSVNPLVLLAIAIAAVVAGLVYAYQKVGWFKAAVDTIAGALMSFFRGAWTVIKVVADGIGSAFSALWPAIKAGAAAVAGFFASAWEGIKGGAAAVGAFISGVWEVITAGAAAVTGAFAVIWDGITAYASFMVGIWAAAWEAVKAGVSAVVGFVVGVWQSITSFLVPIIDAVRGLFSALWGLVGALAELAVAVVMRVWGAVVGWINATVVQPIVAFFSAAWAAVTAAVSVAVAIVRAVWAAAWSFINGSIIQPLRAAFSAAWATVTAATNAAVGVIRGVLSAAWSFINGSVIQPIRSVFSAAWAAVSSAASAAMGTVTGAVNRVRSVVDSVTGAITGAFRGAWNSVVGVVQGAVDRIAGIIQRIRSMIDGVTGSVRGITGMVRGGRDGVGVMRPDDPASILPGQPFYLTAAAMLPTLSAGWGRTGGPRAADAPPAVVNHNLTQNIEVRDTDDARLVARLAADEWRWATTARAVQA